MGRPWCGWAWPVMALAAGGCTPPPSSGRPTWTATELAAQQRCESGQVDACGELGRSLVGPGRDVRDLQRGLVLLEGACGRNDLRACAVLGDWYAAHDGIENRERATGMLTRACDGGVGEACRGLARLVGSKPLSAASAEELARMNQLFGRACELGDAKGCADAGSMAGLLHGDDAWDDQERFYTRACGLRLPEGCQLLAMHHLRDPATVDQAIAELLRNCAAGDDQSCLQAAVAQAPGIGKRPSCARAAAAAARACLANLDDGCAIQDACASAASREPATSRLRAACDRHSSVACFFWAEAQGTADRAERTYADLCAGHRSRVTDPACARLAFIRLQHATNSSETEGPLADLRRLCDHSVTTACCTLADVYTSGRFVAPDASQATRARSQTCPSCCEPP